MFLSQQYVITINIVAPIAICMEWQPHHHFKAKVKRSGGNWNMRGKLLCVISRKLLSQFVIMSRHLPHHNDYRKLKVHHPNPHHYEPTQVRRDEPPQSLLAAG